MPSPLHPRSRHTTSLFTTTLLVSFLVVGLPHILPCPAPRTSYADADGRRRRIQRVGGGEKAEEGGGAIEDGGRGSRLGDEREGGKEEATEGLEEEGRRILRRAHECPVPKPKGVVGQVLGFGREGGKDAERAQERGEGVER